MMAARARVLVSLLVAAAAPVALSGQQAIFRGGAAAVAFDVAVLAGNRPVAGLTAADFAVTDNGVAQRVVDVTRGTVPMDVTLVIDVSGSVKGTLFASIVAGVDRVRRALRPDDRAAVITFNHRLVERLALASPKAIGTIGLGEAGGMTSLDDAIALSLLAPPPVDRRQMAIVFTDGVDTASFLDEPSVLDAARRTHTAIFVVASTFGFAPQANSSVVTVSTTDSDLPTTFFNALAETTGGVVQIVETPPVSVTINGVSQSLGQSQTVDASFLRAVEDFRTSYVVRYNVDGVPASGWHDVEVRVTKPGTNYKIRTRKGYIGG